MKRKTVLFLVFLLTALVQLFVPFNMIMIKELTLKEGKEFKFLTAPIDPTDPFRGKYIDLNYRNSTFDVDPIEIWTSGETVYIYLSTDEGGYAIIDTVAKVPPLTNEDYLKATIQSIAYGASNTLTIAYPFDRFYMEETKAPEAELVYRKFEVDSNTVTYSLVSIREGKAVLKDVKIDGVSIRYLVKE